MIRINLMAVERDRAKRRIGIGFESRQKVTLACGTIFVVVIGLVVWQALAARGETRLLDEQLASVDRELGTMSDVVERRNLFEDQGAELARRVALIEELRAGQGGPVRMLDQVSWGLPDGVWLTELRQEGPDISIQGQATTLTALSDMVVALERSGYFVLPVQIVDSQSETQEAGEVVRFELRAEFRLPSS
jgi:type IV pilus assembly protein PilN